MKKFKNILFVVLMLFTFFFVVEVNAEGETKEESIFKEVFKSNFNNEVDGFVLNTKLDSDGYISTVTSVGTSAIVVKYDFDGKMIWSTDSIYSISPDLVVTKDNYIFVTTRDGVLVLNSKDGSEVKSITFEDELGFPGGRSFFDYGDNYILVGLKNQYGSSSNSYIVVNKLDSKGNIIGDAVEVELLPDTSADSNVVGSYYGAYSDGNNLYLLVNQAGKISLIKFDKDLSYTETALDVSGVSEDGLNAVKMGTFTNMATDEDKIYFSTQYGIFTINNGKLIESVIASKSGIDGLDFTSLVVKDEYIIAGGMSNNSDGNKVATLVVYDDEFKVLEKIDLNDTFSIDATTNTFNLVKGIYPTTDGILVGGMFGVLNTNNWMDEKAFVIEYELDYDIVVKTDGNGTVTASKTTSYSGEVVEFTIEPKTGYTLKKVVVTTASGETLEFTDYKFTMPSSDVEIYAEFVPIVNPSTGLSNPFMICGTALAGAGITYCFLKKKKYI